MTASEAFRRHLEELERRALHGDVFAAQSLSAVALVATGWSYGDPDPEDPDPDGGESADEFDFAGYLCPDQVILGKMGQLIEFPKRAARAA